MPLNGLAIDSPTRGNDLPGSSDADLPRRAVDPWVASSETHILRSAHLVQVLLLRKAPYARAVAASLDGGD